MSRLHRSAAAAVLAAALAPAVVAPVHAFRVESSFGVTSTAPVHPASLPPTRFVHWDVREFPGCRIPYAVAAAGTADSGATGGHAAIAASFATWSAVAPTPVTYERRPNAGTIIAGRDSINLFAFDPTNANAMFGNPLSSVLALTSVWTQAGTGRILESDVIFNDRDWQWDDVGDDFNNVVSANAQPFAINAGDTLRLRVDGGAVRTVAFTNANITPGAATAAQVQAALWAQVPEAIWVGTPGGRVRILSPTMTGVGTIEITGGTGGVPAAFGFPAGPFVTRRADIETVSLHEIGHFVGLAHSSDDPNEPNATYSGAVMYALAPATGTKRALTADDVVGYDFLYTPDYGDAPEGAPDHFQTLTRTGTPSRRLNGVVLVQPDDGPGHLFGYAAVDSLQFEWLGAGIDDALAECEALAVDAFDDGVSYPNPLIPGQGNPVTVRIRYRNASRYAAGNPARTLYFNGYFDFDSDGQFTPADREIWWSGNPTTGTASSSANWQSADYSVPGQITLTFDVIVSFMALTRPDNWARFRLDVGEDEGRVANHNGDLGPATGIAQFGEVEDHPYRVDVATPALIAAFTAEPEGEGVALAWSLPGGVNGPRVRLHRAEAGGAEVTLGEFEPGPDGGRHHDRDVVAGRTYDYRIAPLVDGRERGGATARVTVPALVLALEGVRPNPAPGHGVVRFTLPAAGRARITLLSIAGRIERVLADRTFDPGAHAIALEGGAGGPLPAGVYFVRLEHDGATRVARIAIVR